MVPAENTIVVNVRPGSKSGKTTISGKLDISNLLQGITSWTVESTTAPTGTYGATIEATAVDPAAPLPAPMPTLLLTVTPPGSNPTQFSWPINIVR
jgi:hypothetical protein